MTAGKENKVLVILPTYNEAENIGRLLVRLTEEIPDIDILVVDDNSPDGTEKIVSNFMRQDPKVHLLKRARKDGLAAAYIAGFLWGLGQKYGALIEMDADFSHDPSDLLNFIKELNYHDAVVGCRYMEGGGTSGWSPLRKFISRAGNIYAQWLLDLPYRDLTGGFNAWKREVLERIDISKIRSRGYAFQVELKFRTDKAGFKIKEIPIHFRNRQLGKSKMSGTIVWEAALRVIEMKRATTV